MKYFVIIAIKWNCKLHCNICSSPYVQNVCLLNWELSLIECFLNKHLPTWTLEWDAHILFILLVKRDFKKFGSPARLNTIPDESKSRIKFFYWLCISSVSIMQLWYDDTNLKQICRLNCCQHIMVACCLIEILSWKSMLQYYPI